MDFKKGDVCIYSPLKAEKGLKLRERECKVHSFNEKAKTYIVWIKFPGHFKRREVAEKALRLKT